MVRNKTALLTKYNPVKILSGKKGETDYPILTSQFFQLFLKDYRLIAKGLS